MCMSRAKRLLVMSIIFTVLAFIGLNPNVSAAEKDLNYEVLKYNTEDTSIANDYFNKPAKITDDGKVLITVNHAHWITGMTIEGKKGTVINEDKAKDERTTAYEISKTSGKVQGTIDVYIDEEVNGKPFKYDYHYNITYLFKGDDNSAAATATTSDQTTDKESSDTTTASSSSATPQSGSSEKAVENPQTSAGLPMYFYAVPAVALILFIMTLFVNRKYNRGDN